jgi:hypothetical protein
MRDAAYPPNPPNGYSTMIERMNNVEHRMLASPQHKRRKLETEEGFELMPGFGMGGSGIMGQHIRESREQGFNQFASTNVETVDLTEGGRSFLRNWADPC